MGKMRGGETLTLAGSILRTESMGIAFKKNSELTQQVNKILKEMRADGTLAKISSTWFPGQDITVK
jgi:ABC-type amino acid transport substrate-binding protein